MKSKSLKVSNNERKKTAQMTFTESSRLSSTPKPKSLTPGTKPDKPKAKYGKSVKV